MPDILIVEDDRPSGEAMVAMLEAVGYSSRLCQSPLAAIQALQQETFRVMLTDINMPQITGLELLIWVKKHHPLMQVLLMTAYPVDAIEHLALAGGALKILAKPFTAVEMSRQIRLCLQPGMASNVERIQLSDLLQVLALDQSGRLIEIHDAEQGVTARLGVEHQLLCYAEWQSPQEHLTGYPACLKALTLTHGRFSERSLQDVAPNLQYPLQDALLTVATQHDESRAQKQYAHLLCYSRCASAIQVPLKILQNQHFRIQQTDSLSAEALTAEDSVLFHLSARSELPLLETLCQQCPTTPFVVLEDGVPSQSVQAPNLLRRFAAPWPMRELRDFLRPFHQLGLSGHLVNLGLLSQLQLFLMSREPKRLCIKNLSAKTSGTLYLANHRILEAVAGCERGEQAFFTLTRTMSGVVMESDWKDPPSRSLEDTTPVRLFMQATRDHANLGDMQTFILQKVEALL